MAEDWASMGEEDLGAALAAAGRGVRFPPTPEMTGMVSARLRAGAALPGARRPVWQRLAAVAAVAAAVAGGLVAASPAARHAVADFLGIGGERIILAPSSPTPAVRQLGQDLDLGIRTTIGQAQRAVPFPILRPGVPQLGPPDSVYLSQRVPGGVVSLVYGSRPGIVPASNTGVAVLISELQGRVQEPFVEKTLGPGTHIEAVQVRGNPGFWITGSPHQITYLGPDGRPIFESVRLAGNVLVWQQGPVTLRIESDLSRSGVLRIAETMGP